MTTPHPKSASSPRARKKPASALLFFLIFLIASLFVSLFVITAHPKTAHAASSVDLSVQAKYKQSEARTMLTMMNKERTSGKAWYWASNNKTKVNLGKLPALQYDYNLEKIAMQRAVEIAVRFSHTRPNGEKTFTTFKEYNVGYTTAGENIAAGFSTIRGSHIGFMEENEKYAGQGHRRNILNKSYSRVGVGFCEVDGTWYVAVTFGHGTPKSSKTNPVNGNQTRNVRALTSILTKNSLSCSKNKYSLSLGNSSSFPSINLSTYPKEHYPYNKAFKATLKTVSWSADSKIVKKSGSSFVGNKNGTGWISASALGKAVKIPVSVKSDSLSSAKVSGYKSSYTYTGKDIKPSVKVTKNGKTLKSGKDYKVSYSSNKNIGSAKITIQGIGLYKGASKNVNFNILPKANSITSISNDTDGVKIAWNGASGASGYIIYRAIGGGSYKNIKTISNNTVRSFVDTSAKNSGSTYKYKIQPYTVQNGITYKSQSTSAVKSIYRINAVANSSLKFTLMNQPNTMAVKWNKVANAAGYQIRYKPTTTSTWKTAKVTKSGVTTITLKNIKKARYTFQVRGFKTVNKNVVYGGWSKPIDVIVK